MPKANRARYLVLALLALLTASAHFAHRAYADSGRSEPGRQGFWSLAHSSTGAERGRKPGQPVDAITLTAAVDRLAVMHHGEGVVHVEVSLKSPERKSDVTRKPTDIVVIIDRSGSMAGEKIHYARSALHQLVDRLGENDRFGLVAYETEAQVLVPLSFATGSARSHWRRVIDRIESGGSTNMSEGLDLALSMLEKGRLGYRAARALLLSDGLANTGDSSLEGLVARARRAVAGEYVLSTMGIGADFDENLMTKLAGAGTGAFYYLAKLAVLPRFVDAELATANQTVARGAVLELYLEPGVSITGAMGLPFEQQGSRVTIPLGSLYAAHERQLWLTLNVPTQTQTHLPLGRVATRFQTDAGEQRQLSKTLPTLKCVTNYDEFRSSVRPDVWERAVLNEALGRSQEEMGDAIARGTAADVDRALSEAVQNRRLASELGSKPVLQRIAELEMSAKQAKAAQSAPAPVRNAEAKRQKATGHINRNQGAYVNADAMTGF